MLDLGIAKHSPEESRMLCGPPHESNHPVQYSITILGWTLWAPQNEKLAGQKRQMGSSSFREIPALLPSQIFPDDILLAVRAIKSSAQVRTKGICTSLSSTCGLHTARRKWNELPKLVQETLRSKCGLHTELAREHRDVNLHQNAACTLGDFSYMAFGVKPHFAYPLSGKENVLTG